MSIYFDSDRSGRSEVWRIPATGGDAQQVTHNEGMAPLDSPDGKTLFFIRLVENQRAVFAMPVAGGPEHQLLDAINAWQYTPAETGIYYVPARQQGQQPGDTRCDSSTTLPGRVERSERFMRNTSGTA